MIRGTSVSCCPVCMLSWGGMSSTAKEEHVASHFGAFPSSSSSACLLSFSRETFTDFGQFLDDSGAAQSKTHHHREGPTPRRTPASRKARNVHLQTLDPQRSGVGRGMRGTGRGALGPRGSYRRTLLQVRPTLSRLNSVYRFSITYRSALRSH